MANFGWDYPPGVTGNEPQIAGYPLCPCGDECDVVDTDCGHDAFECETYLSRDGEFPAGLRTCRPESAGRYHGKDD